MFAKIDVNGESADPLFVFLKEQVSETRDAQSEEFIEKLKSYSQVFDENDIKWNFSKFLIDRDRNVIAWYPPTFVPEMLENDIEKLL